MDKQAEIERIKQKYAERNKEIERQHRKEMARIIGGGVLQGASALPIFNIPYVGTGLGGALFETGNAIMQGKNAKDIAKDAGKGFIIGETVGAIPYVGKVAGKTKAGQAVANQASNFANRLAETKIGQKVAEIAPKVEDVLMTDIKAYNPFKQTQTAYHGSPYDFAKFSNEAIGTGEGAQAHGMGHYAAKSKNIGEKYRENITTLKQLTDTNNPRNKYIDLKRTINSMEELKKKSGINNPIVDEVLNEAKLKMTELQKKYKPEQYLNDSTGQLYKLSIPKDDVMLREHLPFSQQPIKVQESLKKIQKKQLLNEIADLENNKEFILKEFNDSWASNEAKKMDEIIAEKYLQINNLGNENLSYKNILKSIADYKNWEGLDKSTKKTIQTDISNKLNKAGIKGISYNGGIDGEARVIFNPDDIEIVRKYYNQPTFNELINKNTNMGAFMNALMQD